MGVVLVQLACGNGCYQHHVGKGEQRGVLNPSLPTFSFCKSIRAMAQHSRRGRVPVGLSAADAL